MSRSINVNEESVIDVHRKITDFLELTNSSLSALAKSIDNAEIEGWTDHDYNVTKDLFDSNTIGIKSDLKEIEENLEPHVKRVLNSIAGYN
jgi:hypothetical protein